MKKHLYHQITGYQEIQQKKTLVATNTGEVDQAVRILVTESWTTDNDGTLNGWIHSDGTKSTHTTQSELETDERVTILNLANTDDWTKVGNYYYYNYKLAPGEDTTSFLESVTFNPKTKLDDTCTTSTNNGVTTTTCNSSGDDYDNATYTLTFTIETIQYNKYASAWNTNVEIQEVRPVPGTLILLDKTNPVSITNYTDGNTHEMYSFEHEATSQTPALIDYRYIGNNPYNYVYFNCDDLDNQSSETCEVWRIIGVFDVERPNPEDNTQTIVEQRIKLIRDSVFDNIIPWDDDTDGLFKNDWTEASLKIFLNGDYYNQSGDAVIYGLKVSAQGMIDDAKYYLGAGELGNVEYLYNYERGNILCKSCGNDVTKLNWVGKVALMYPSDAYMVYGKGVNNSCYNSPSGCGSRNPENGWIYNSNHIAIGKYNQVWTIMPSSYNSYTAHHISGGSLHDYSGSYPVSGNTNSSRPTLYLSSSVKIIDGDGSEGNPYKLSL